MHRSKLDPHTTTETVVEIVTAGTGREREVVRAASVVNVLYSPSRIDGARHHSLLVCGLERPCIVCMPQDWKGMLLQMPPAEPQSTFASVNNRMIFFQVTPTKS